MGGDATFPVAKGGTTLLRATGVATFGAGTEGRDALIKDYA
jgi:hypothetical protein